MISPTAARLHSSATLLLLALAMDDAAMAADPAADIRRKAPDVVQPFDWSGLYFGGHVGFGRGHSHTTVSDPAPTIGSNNFGGLIGGAQIGANYVLPSRLLLGLEADITFPN